MKKKCNFYLSILFIFFISCTGEKYKTQVISDANGYKYESITNDPAKVRIYTLNNGLKVYLSVNKDEPRIQTVIGVRAGSNNDPEKTTGLAHYFEHLMFKGTSDYGTTNWEKEKPLLDSISNLFEKYKDETNEKIRKDIYAQIDKFSIEAAKYAIPNEYDKMLAEIGAKGTNAFTSNEEIAYINDIPSNELNRWLALEKNRFGNVVLRLFHTELETVYEEFNMYQDRDQMRAYTEFSKELFPKNPLGRDVIGYPEHLKNPSQVNILNYKNTWYVPNNMVICLCGDIDMEKTIKMVDETFGTIPSKPIPEVPFIKEEPITAPVEMEISGPDAEFMLMGYRCDGESNPNKKYLYLLSKILYNGQAGLFDLDLVQGQKILDAYAYTSFNSQYGNITISVTPREKQTLEETKDLVLQEIEKLKKGDYPDWMIEAIANKYRLSNLRQFQTKYKAYSFLDAFVLNKKWADVLSFGDVLEKVTKKELTDFANEFFKTNYVVLYKKKGEAKGLVKVQKPPLTAVKINRNDESKFFTEWKKMPTETMTPLFVDFNSAITKKQLQEGVELNTIQTEDNDLFSSYFIVDIGKDNNLKFPLAVNLLPYLGTTKHTAAEMKQELFRYGLYTSVFSSDNRSYVYVSGLNKNYEKGIQILEEIVNSSVPDTSAYKKYAERTIKERDDIKLNQDNILYTGLMNYAQYGEKSSANDVLTNDEIRKENPEDLVNLVKSMLTYPHKIFYCGPSSISEVESVIKKNHSSPKSLETIPPKTNYPELNNDKNLVLVANYDMSQVNFMMISKGPKYSPELKIQSSLFNQYYGGSMASVVFQEVRESQGMAYSAYAGFQTPSRPEDSFYLFGFVGTQADKLKLATSTMNRILNEFIQSDHYLDVSKKAILNRIAATRLYRENLFFTYLSNQDMNIDHDIRKDIYDYVEKANMDDLKNFFNSYIKEKKFTYCMVGNLKDLDMNTLKSLGEVKEIPLNELFGY